MRLTSLKNKLYSIVFCSFVVRVIAFFLLPNSGSNLAPDEGNYGALTEWIAQGKAANEYPYSSLYIISRSLIVPASFLNRIGISGLDSVRIIASLYGLMTLALIANLFLRLFNSREVISNWTSKNQLIVLFLFGIIGFLPSHLIWSFLGLREAAMEFWVIVVFALVFYLFEHKGAHPKKAFIGIVITIPLVFSSRPQVGWVLGITLLIYFLVRIKVRAAQILIPFTLIGIMLGYVASTAYSIETVETFTAVKVVATPTETPTPTPTETTRAEFDASLLCKSEGQIIGEGDTRYKCLNKVEKKTIVGLKNPGSTVVDQADAIPLHHELNQVGAASVIRTVTCPVRGESKVGKYLCLAYRAPYSTFTFLFRPMIGSDVTSSSSLFAATENIFWLAAFLFIIVMFIRNRRLAFFGALAPSLLFMTIYVVAAGAYEGNMGTAFRHKSLILWVVILLLASTIVATQQRKAELEGISSPSQE